MTTTVYGSFRRSRVGGFDIGRLGEMFATTYDPSTEIESFGRDLVRVAARRVHDFGDAVTDNLEFALGVLHPTRIDGISTYIIASRVGRDALSTYLEMLKSDAECRIAAAKDSDAVADVVTEVLDDLHGYVLAHCLVSDEYREAERRIAAQIERHQRAELPADVAEVEEAKPPAEPSLALAA